MTLVFDTCFSGGAIAKNRYMNFLKKDLYLKHRFIETDIIPQGTKKKSSFAKTFSNNNIIQFAACGEDQSAADAYIDGKYRGAFTYFWIKTFSPGIFCSNWIVSTKYAIKNIANCIQKPTVWGDNRLINDSIFTKKTN